MGLSERLRERLARGPALLLDSAMGTQLERRGVSSHLPLWSARALLDAPETILAIHREEVAAGADVLTANTFRTHRRTLAKEGLEARAQELTQRAVALAREAAETKAEVFVVGSLSPLEDCYRPDLAPDDQALTEEHEEQAAALAAAGVDGILVETHNNVRELAAAARAARRTGLSVIASMTTDGHGHLLSGELVSEAVELLRAAAPDALSVNCVPARRLAGDLRQLASAAPGHTLGAYGNLGPPSDREGLRVTDEISPREYAQLAAGWLSIGARIVGGCCGTTPAHTAALAKLLRKASSSRAAAGKELSRGRRSGADDANDRR